MPKFWKSKKFWLALLALIGLGAFIYYQFFYEETTIISDTEEEQKEQYKGDTKTPYSQIRFPPTNVWYHKDFQIRVLDEDPGGSGIKEGSCQYKVLSYSPKNEEISSGWRSRECNSLQTISLGPEGKCKFEGKDSCYIYVRSRDKAGNWYSPSEEELSVKGYSIDFTKPTITQEKVEEKDDSTYNFRLKLKDNFRIRGCLFYIDGKRQGEMDLKRDRCRNNCLLEKEITISKEGTHDVYAYCQDYASNWKKSKTLQLKRNTSPKISLCNVDATSGTKDTEFHFSVKASDVDNDSLSYTWIFGDNQTSTEKNPTYKYSKTGLFRPKVKVSDGKGEASCETAWIDVEKN